MSVTILVRNTPTGTVLPDTISFKKKRSNELLRLFLPQNTKEDNKENKAVRATILVYNVPTEPVQYTYQYHPTILKKKKSYVVHKKILASITWGYNQGTKKQRFHSCTAHAYLTWPTILSHITKWSRGIYELCSTRKVDINFWWTDEWNNSWKICCPCCTFWQKKGPNFYIYLIIILLNTVQTFAYEQIFSKNKIK